MSFKPVYLEQIDAYRTDQLYGINQVSKHINQSISWFPYHKECLGQGWKILDFSKVIQYQYNAEALRDQYYTIMIPMTNQYLKKTDC